jgi:hypothetical protein
MAQLSYDDILFSNVNKWTTDENGVTSYHGILVASKLNQKNGQGYKILDAIDIDWNNAWVSTLNTYINTTADLLYVLDELNKQDDVDKIDQNLQAIWKQLEEITSTYITYTSLYDILSTSYQAKLVAGDYITIDNDTNVITTYDLASYAYLNEHYTTKIQHQDLWDYLLNNYYDKTESVKIIQEFVKAGIDKVIDGADQAFDTLKEIADWILDQNRYVPVTPKEVFDALSDPNNEDEFYWFNEETGKYVQITDPSEVVMDGSVQYFRLENYLTDIKKLIEEVDELQETVGTVYLSYYFDTETSSYVYLDSYTYTGMQGDIHDLEIADMLLKERIENVETISNVALATANEAINTANMAYDTANMAYDTASYSLDLTLDSIELATSAYVVAKKASEDVGVPSYIGRGWVEIEYNDITSYIESGETVYYWDEYNGQYAKAVDPYYEDYMYFIYEDSTAATGLTKRVEDVEYEIGELDIRVDFAQKTADEALYRLKVDNSESSYVKLSLSPQFYENNNWRTLHIETDEASINPETGEVLSYGVATLNTVYDVYAYASSWQILDEITNTEIPTETPSEF